MILPEVRINFTTPIDLLNECDCERGFNRLVVYLWVQRLGIHFEGDTDDLIAVIAEKTNLTLHQARVSFYSLVHDTWLDSMRGPLASPDRWFVYEQEWEEGAR